MATLPNSPADSTESLVSTRHYSSNLHSSTVKHNQKGFKRKEEREDRKEGGREERRKEGRK